MSNYCAVLETVSVYNWIDIAMVWYHHQRFSGMEWAEGAD